LTVPRILLDEVLRASKTRLDWGGKGFNVSRALMDLGVDSLAMGLVGGATGRMLERGLTELGIASDLVQIVGETRTNVVVTDANAQQHIKVNEAGPVVQPQELDALLDRVRDRTHPGDVWILSGSLPPGAPPDIYAQLIELVRRSGARTCLDTSGEPLRLGCAARPYLVKPNALEAEEMTRWAIESDADALEAAGFFLEQGIELVALSLGAGGLLLASRREVVRVIPPEVQVRNAVGAGDALLAGIVSAFEQGLSLKEVARWGVAVGTAAAMHEGVAVGSLDEVERLYPYTQLLQLSDTSASGAVQQEAGHQP
jgi:1-phosphofructokinase family hexose kinase